MSIKVEELTKEQWLRKIQHMSRKELIALTIEQQTENERLIHEKTILLRDVASAKRENCK